MPGHRRQMPASFRRLCSYPPRPIHQPASFFSVPCPPPPRVSIGGGEAGKSRYFRYRHATAVRTMVRRVADVRTGLKEREEK